LNNDLDFGEQTIFAFLQCYDFGLPSQGREMRINRILPALFLLLPIGAQAAIEDKQIALCASMKGAIERLACYDQLADSNNLAPKTVSTSEPGKGKWSTSTSTDPLNDKAIHLAMLEANSGKTGRFGERINMIVRCANGETDLYINWSSFLGTEGIALTYRIGKAKAVHSDWDISTDHQSSFYRGSPVKALKAIIESDSFVANVTPYSESPVTATFDTTGAGEALNDIRSSCKW
jgi:type VI secretion system protein VasI